MATLLIFHKDNDVGKDVQRMDLYFSELRLGPPINRVAVGERVYVQQDGLDEVALSQPSVYRANYLQDLGVVRLYRQENP
jgi:hypothetical protein